MKFQRYETSDHGSGRKGIWVQLKSIFWTEREPFLLCSGPAGGETADGILSRLIVLNGFP
jgi:hypothetical protein